MTWRKTASTTTSTVNGFNSHIGSNGTAHATATASAAGFMSAADKSKLDGLTSGGGAYVHPTTDGYIHLPVNGTTNGGKLIVSGSTAGSWTITALPFDFAHFTNGRPNPSETLFRIYMPRSVSFAANLSGSIARCEIAPTADAQIDIRKNGASIGFLRFDAGVKTGVFVVASASNFSVSDCLSFHAAGTQDTTFGDVALMIVGTQLLA